MSTQSLIVALVVAVPMASCVAFWLGRIWPEIRASVRRGGAL